MHEAHLQASTLAILDQGLDLLGSLSPADYTRKLPLAFNASIGGHYRHCLEHFEALARADGDLIDYDARQRDARTETDLAFAGERTRDLASAMAELSEARLRSAVTVRCQVGDAAANSPVVMSSVSRELMYAIIHAVHHYALIKVMAGMLEVELPPSFGVAPSTLKFQRTTLTA